MAYVPTTFVDRSVEFPNRRKLTAVPGQADTFDVTRAEGTVFAEGTKPDAANLNAEFGKIKTETDAINNSLSVITGTLPIGSTSITISNSSITTSSILDFYTSIYGINPLTVTITNGQAVLTFPVQTVSMIVGVKVGGTYA